jgi:hypothetical protein
VRAGEIQEVFMNHPNKQDIANERHARAERRKERGKTPEQLGYAVYPARLLT